MVSFFVQETPHYVHVTVLNHFHLLTLQSKIAAYDFYLALERQTDNTGTTKLQVRSFFHPYYANNITCQSCYEQLLLSMRIWRHLKMTKRAGCGLNPAGVDTTQPGECAVECPVCPHPGKNLPENRDTVSEETQCGFFH